VRFALPDIALRSGSRHRTSVPARRAEVAHLSRQPRAPGVSAASALRPRDDPRRGWRRDPSRRCAAGSSANLPPRGTDLDSLRDGRASDGA
jgi:hypothetical protein